MSDKKTAEQWAIWMRARKVIIANSDIESEIIAFRKAIAQGREERSGAGDLVVNKVEYRKLRDHLQCGHITNDKMNLGCIECSYQIEREAIAEWLENGLCDVSNCHECLGVALIIEKIRNGEHRKELQGG